MAGIVYHVTLLGVKPTVSPSFLSVTRMLLRIPVKGISANLKQQKEMNSFSNLISQLNRIGYSRFSLLDGSLFCPDDLNWSCAVCNLHIPIRVYPDSVVGATLYLVECPDGKRGTFTIEHPSLDTF